LVPDWPVKVPYLAGDWIYFPSPPADQLRAPYRSTLRVRPPDGGGFVILPVHGLRAVSTVLRTVSPTLPQLTAYR
jgi:hypothetical protein